jgi:predicted RNA-binding Zn-ribbon protein involved in translation (DUF1610 family)
MVDMNTFAITFSIAFCGRCHKEIKIKITPCPGDQDVSIKCPKCGKFLITFYGARGKGLHPTHRKYYVHEDSDNA